MMMRATPARGDTRASVIEAIRDPIVVRLHRRTVKIETMDELVYGNSINVEPIVLRLTH
jgi:hypothetical protein